MKLGQEVWFHSEKGLHQGYVEKINKNTINIIVDDRNRPEGYQLWRVEEFFLADTPEIATEMWNDYKRRLKEMYALIDARRKLHSFNKGLIVLVEPFSNPPYKGIVLKVCKATLEIATNDGRFMKVDKSLCTPTYELLTF